MFYHKAKKIIELKNRVKELEEKLCPCSQHDWVQISSSYVPCCGGFDIDSVYHYKCRKCGKEITSTRRET